MYLHGLFSDLLVDFYEMYKLQEDVAARRRGRKGADNTKLKTREEITKTCSTTFIKLGTFSNTLQKLILGGCELFHPMYEVIKKMPPIQDSCGRAEVVIRSLVL